MENKYEHFGPNVHLKMISFLALLSNKPTESLTRFMKNEIIQ